MHTVHPIVSPPNTELTRNLKKKSNYKVRETEHAIFRSKQSKEIWCVYARVLKGESQNANGRVQVRVGENLAQAQKKSVTNRRNFVLILHENLWNIVFDFLTGMH